MTPRERWIAVLAAGLLAASHVVRTFFPIAAPLVDQAQEQLDKEIARVPRCALDAGLERCTSFAGSAYELNDHAPGAPCTCPER